MVSETKLKGKEKDCKEDEQLRKQVLYHRTANYQLVTEYYFLQNMGTIITVSQELQLPICSGVLFYSFTRAMCRQYMQ